LGWLVLAGLFLAGCGAGERLADGPVVRDSAGVVIVENSAPLHGGGGVLVLSSAPLVEIGVLEGEEAYQLNGVAGALRLRDGRIVVANRGTSELRFYDVGGRHLRSVGGKGGGPGEFQYIGEPLRLAGDSLLVGERAAARLSLFSAAGDFVISHGTRTPVGVLADGTLVGRRTLRAPGDQLQSGLLREAEALVRHTRAGEELDTLGVVRGSERHLHLEQSGGTIESISISTPLFGRTQQLVVGPDRVYAGSADSFEVEVYRPEHGLERLIRVMRPSRPVTPAVLAAKKREELAAAPDAARRQGVERRFAELTPPEFLPAYSVLQLDAAGLLWVEEYRAPGEVEPRWQLFDSEGRWLTTVETPVRFRVLDIGVDYLLGVWRDELDVEYVHLYGLERRDRLGENG
jgi:hypothetical protein